MKVKFLKDLAPEELERYRQSELYKLSHAGYRQCGLHLDYYREYFGPEWEDVSLVAYDDSTSTQILVLLVDDLQGYSIEQYATEIGHSWGV